MGSASTAQMKPGVDFRPTLRIAPAVEFQKVNQTDLPRCSHRPEPPSLSTTSGDASSPPGMSPAPFSTTAFAAAKAAATTLANRPFRIGIVGGGPAGFYTAARLLGLPGSEETRVDLFELLPVPFGLSRFGVAPDHPEVKVRESPPSPHLNPDAHEPHRIVNTSSKRRPETRGSGSSATSPSVATLPLLTPQPSPSPSPRSNPTTTPSSSPTVHPSIVPSIYPGKDYRTSSPREISSIIIMDIPTPLHSSLPCLTYPMSNM